MLLTSLMAGCNNSQKKVHPLISACLALHLLPLQIVCSADGNLAFPEQEQTYLRCFGVSCSCSCRRAPAPSYMVANG